MNAIQKMREDYFLPFFTETMAAHGEHVGKQATPKTDPVSVLCRSDFIVNSIDCVVVGNRLCRPVGGRCISRDAYYARTRAPQVVFSVCILLKSSSNHLQARPQGTMVTGGSGGINDQECDAGKCRHTDKPCRQGWCPVQHGRRRARTQEHLKPSKHSIEAREILLSDGLVSDLGCQVETNVMAKCLYRRFGGGGGGAKFVSDFCPKSPGGCLGGGGAGLGGGGGGGDGRCSLLACHIGSLIQIAPRSLVVSRGGAKMDACAQLRLSSNHSLKSDHLQSQRVSAHGLSTAFTLREGASSACGSRLLDICFGQNDFPEIPA